jgi:predicted nucleotidyltransferase component of viral defense system
MKIIEWVNEYDPKNSIDVENALREIMQEVALAGLERSGFFTKAAFYGGTALRIFHGLNRFSEDLDFSLLEPDSAFDIMSYLQPVITEFAAMGMVVSVSQKKKSAITSINSAFLKPDTLWSELELEKLVPQSGLSRPPAIKIKIEVDKEPPPGFQTEELLLLKPFSFYVKCFTLPDLFAGKMHALLFRKWKQRVKGRDWYDMEWYIRKGVGLNLDHFHQRAINSNDLENKKLTEKQFRKLLDERIDAVSINAIKEDIIRFIPHPEQLDIWSREYFHDLVKKIKIAL